MFLYIFIFKQEKILPLLSILLACRKEKGKGRWCKALSFPNQVSVHAWGQQYSASVVAPVSCPQKRHNAPSRNGRGWCRAVSTGSQSESTPIPSPGDSTLKMPSRAAMPTKCLTTHILQDSNQQLTSNRNNILPCSRQGRIHYATQGDRDQLALGALLAPWASQYISCRQKML